MKSIETLVEDIQKIFQFPHEFDAERTARFGQHLANTVANRIAREKEEPRLRMSNLGTHCDRKLWYTMHRHEDRLPLPVSAKVKFLYGDILEALLIFLAIEAGHTVEGMQTPLELEGIRGSRDAIIDGVLIDVKSASTQSFKKFKKGLTYAEDDFGYLTQLFGYHQASYNDPLLVDKNRCAFLVIDKQLGHICLDVHNTPSEDMGRVVRVKQSVIASPGIPQRRYEDAPDGKSGNRKLAAVCSYCDWRHLCWEGLRAYAYSGKPRYLTQVAKEPRVQELSVLAAALEEYDIEEETQEKEAA